MLYLIYVLKRDFKKIRLHNRFDLKSEMSKEISRNLK